jgi:hypothetical protein
MLATLITEEIQRLIEHATGTAARTFWIPIDQMDTAKQDGLYVLG